MVSFTRCKLHRTYMNRRWSPLLTTKTYTVQEAMDILGMSKRDLVEASGLNCNTVKRILSNDPEEFNTRLETAILIAEALGLTIHEIKWPRDITRVGRPPHTGCPITTVTKTITITRVVEIKVPVCPTCRLELPLTGVCDTCS
ncbi:TPA: hypothetical protein DHU97_03910 [Candidatus Saccharibacteria bacterium]|nr:hypothetical protein [Candidatus Saccharibacteria bacterium]